MRILAALLAVVACGASGPAATAGQDALEVLTLDHALALAREHNRPTQAASLDEARAADRTAALHTQRYPAFDLKVFEGGFLSPLAFTFREGAFGTYPATGPIPFTDIEVESPRTLATGVLFTAVQPLTQLRRLSTGERLLDLERQIAAQKTRAAQQQAVGDVRRAYYGLQQVRAGLDAIGQALTQLEELQRVVGQYVERQVALEGDRLAVQTERARAEHTRLTLRNQQATLQETLNLLMGRDLAMRFDVEPLREAAPAPQDLDAVVARAREHRPAVLEAELNVRRADANLRLKRQERMPDVSLAFGMLRLFNVEVLPPTWAAASVLVSWEPFDWGRRSHEADERERTLEQARLGLEEARARVEVDVREKSRAVADARDALTVARLARDTAAERLRVATDRYRVEASLLKDVLEAQTALARTTQEYQQALGAFWTARADFDQAVGTDE